MTIPKSTRPTITDVARDAQVSIKTVSRVVNDVHTVAPEIRTHVQASIDRLGYRRNELARRLRSGHTSRSIGLLIEDLSNPFYSTMAAGVADVALQHGVLLLTASSEEDSERQRTVLLEMCARRVEGLVVVPTGTDHSFLQPEIDAGTPSVFVDRPPIGAVADAVMLDNEGGARAAVRHLVDRGHRRIALLADSTSIYTMAARLSAARGAVADLGVDNDPSLIQRGLHTPGDTHGAVRHLLQMSQPPTAFFCSNNRVCIGVVEELRRHGGHQDVVGFDDFDASSAVTQPLSIVVSRPRELGRIAAEMLVERIAGLHSPPRRVILPVELVDKR